MSAARGDAGQRARDAAGQPAPHGAHPADDASSWRADSVTRPCTHITAFLVAPDTGHFARQQAGAERGSAGVPSDPARFAQGRSAVGADTCTVSVAGAERERSCIPRAAVGPTRR